MATAATATTDPHVHLLPAERTAGLMRWLHRGLPGVAIPQDITWERALADLRAAGRAAGREPAVSAPRRRGRGAAPLRRRAQRARAGRGAGRRRAQGRPRPGARAAHRDRGPRHARAEAASDGAALLARTPRARAGDRSAGGLRRCRCTCTRASTSGTGGATTWASWSASPSDTPRSRWCCATARSRAWSGRPRWRAATRRCGSTPRTCSAASSWRPSLPAPGSLDKVADLFDAAPDRIFFGTDYPAAMGSLERAARPGRRVAGRRRAVGGDGGKRGQVHE